MQYLLYAQYSHEVFKICRQLTGFHTMSGQVTEGCRIFLEPTITALRTSNPAGFHLAPLVVSEVSHFIRTPGVVWIIQTLPTSCQHPRCLSSLPCTGPSARTAHVYTPPLHAAPHWLCGPNPQLLFRLLTVHSCPFLETCPALRAATLLGMWCPSAPGAAQTRTGRDVAIKKLTPLL